MSSGYLTAIIDGVSVKSVDFSSMRPSGSYPFVRNLNAPLGTSNPEKSSGADASTELDTFGRVTSVSAEGTAASSLGTSSGCNFSTARPLFISSMMLGTSAITWSHESTLSFSLNHALPYP